MLPELPHPPELEPPKNRLMANTLFEDTKALIERRL